MSFGVLSIALDRLRTVYGLMRMEKTGKMAGGVASSQIRFVKVNVFRARSIQMKIPLTATDRQTLSAFDSSLVCGCCIGFCSSMVCVDYNRYENLVTMYNYMA
ncbi:hypothetical protein ACQ4LE_001534 [Meloidogyne hapla]